MTKNKKTDNMIRNERLFFSIMIFILCTSMSFKIIFPEYHEKIYHTFNNTNTETIYFNSNCSDEVIIKEINNTEIIFINVTDSICINKLRVCFIERDNINVRLYDYMITNNTVYKEELEHSLVVCEYALNKTQEKLNIITGVI